MPRARRDKIDPTNEHVLLKLTVVDPRRDVYFAAKCADRRNNLFARLPLFLLYNVGLFFLYLLRYLFAAACSLEKVVSSRVIFSYFAL
jgi:hypothetical protein